MYQNVPDDDYAGAALVAPLIAPDQGGLIPDASYEEYRVLPLLSSDNLSPPTDPVRSPDGYATPAPSQGATVWVRHDIDSAHWWGGRGNETDWPDPFYGELPPPMIPSDTSQHFSEGWEPFLGGYPSISRNAPPAWGFSLPDFNPNLEQ